MNQKGQSEPEPTPLDPHEPATQLEMRRALKALARPLAFIFWGAVLVLFDVTSSVTVGSVKVGFDLLPDWLGLVLITLGMGIIAFGGLVRGMEETVITMVTGVFLFFALGSVASWYVPELRQPTPFVVVLLTIVGTAAIVAFCAVMSGQASRFGLPRLARSWILIAMGVVLLYTLPSLLLFLFPGVPAFEAIVLVASVCLVIALVVAFLLITHRMRQIAKKAIPEIRQREGTV